MATILHLSADHPDPLVPAKTRAIANLLALVPEHRHLVYSLNRIGWRAGIAALDFADASGQDHRAVAYGALPKGLFLKHYLDRLADWIAADMARRGLVPDAVHAHKLSVEGPVGWRLAQAWGVPLIVSIQGDSDTRIIGAKRELRGLYRAIWAGAAMVFPFTPWARDRIAAVLGPRQGPAWMLPCPGPGDRLQTPRVVGPVIRTAFHLGVAGRKNAAGLIAALGQAATQVPDITLEVIGGGDPAAFARLARLADRLAPGRVRFLGAQPHDRIADLFNGACGFALVSHRESFGMVFAEALLAGAPCLIPRGWGIDGYLAEGDGVLCARSTSQAEIAEGLVRLVRDQAALKARLDALGRRGDLAFLQRDQVAQTYRGGLTLALADKGGAGCA